MRLERARAELRSRPPYEAADLGVRLLRTLARPTLRTWLGFVLPLQLLLVWVCSPFAVGFAYLALWWFKPVYERAYALVLGHGLFGDAPDLRTLYRRLWSDARRGLLGDLSWRRFDPARALVAPIGLLEGLAGGPAARRRRVLKERSSTTAGWLLSVCSALELATTFGLALAARTFLPKEASWIADELWTLDQELVGQRLFLICYVLSLALVEPLFVSAGFGLYINRRTDLEGWDVELTFRRMARRLAGAALGVVIAASALALPPWLAGAAADTPQASSQSAVDDSLRLPAPEVEHDGEAARAMARVLARPELRRNHVEEHWELRERPADPSVRWTMAPWLNVLADLVANSFVALVWGLLALIVVVVIYQLIKRVDWAPSERTEPTLPSFTARLREGDTRTLTLAEIAPNARAHLAQGEHVAALSLLYVGTLLALTQRDGLHLPRQATEGQCAAAVRAAGIAEHKRALFAELTEVWQLSAYAHARPERARVLELCARFEASFGAGV